MPNIYRRHHLPACHTKTIFGLTIGEQASPMEGWMTTTKQDIDAALACLTEAFPRTFVLEKYRTHRPLKVGIAADIPARCPAVERRVLSAALRVYARRVMYLRGLVAGGPRRSRRQCVRRGDRQGRRRCCGQASQNPGVARSQAGRGCGNQGRGAGCEAGGGNGGGRGASSRKGLDAEEKGPFCTHRRFVKSAGEFPAAVSTRQRKARHNRPG